MISKVMISINYKTLDKYLDDSLLLVKFARKKFFYLFYYHLETN